MADIPAPKDWLPKIFNNPKFEFDSSIRALASPMTWADVGGKLLPAVLGTIFLVTIILALFLIIKAGFEMILAQGEKEGLNKARNHLVNAVLGLVFVLCVFIVFNAVQLILGVNLTGQTFFGTNQGGSYGTWGGDGR